MTKTPEDRVSAALATMRGRGGRTTAPRRAVLDTLTKATHLSASEISARLTADDVQIDPSTVHRVLSALADAGVVHTVPVNGTTTYGMADQAHHHTVCNQCGKVRQLHHDLAEALVRAVNADGTVSVDEDGRAGGVVVYGRCTGACPTPA
ncbi:Fur family transcriptional regulator [Dactylosporangium sp. NPDC050688]|uniref:Fur family transcriptional regulator n=1 Tax=Dactylosporangium sp. NPDC050688 TaxID=3157217 RepID=UPI0033F2F860